MLVEQRLGDVLEIEIERGANLARAGADAAGGECGKMRRAGGRVVAFDARRRARSCPAVTPRGSRPARAIWATLRA